MRSVNRQPRVTAEYDRIDTNNVHLLVVIPSLFSNSPELYVLRENF